METRDCNILNQLIKDMGNVLNIVPGTTYSSKDAETLLVIQRRLTESELKQQLRIYNEVFAREKGVSIIDVTNSAIAYIKIKVLLASNQENFDAWSWRELIKEFQSQIARTSNVVKLSKANCLTAESYQKELIELTIQKNESLIKAYEMEISDVERKISRLPVVIEEHLEENDDVEEKPKSDPARKGLVGVMAARITKALESKREEQFVDALLREEEKKRANTFCLEIPFYDDSLVYTEQIVCKDMSSYCLLKKKDNVYFGLSKNVSKGFYDNRDRSLIELTEITDEFIQFMTVDLLSGEYKLKEFSFQEKKSMQMYFDFVTAIFQKNMGITVNIQEYMSFKEYYNRLVLTSLELEEERKKTYYKALPLVECYMAYMEAYNMAFTESKNKLIEKMIVVEIAEMLSDLEQIRDNHIVDKVARKKLDKLIISIKNFKEEDFVCCVETSEEEVVRKSIHIIGSIDPTPESLDPSINFKASDYNDDVAVSVEDMQRIQIKIQFLNQNHVIIDEALFALNNIRRAVYDYLCKQAYIKKIGLYVNEKDVFLFSSKNSSLSVPVLTQEMKKTKGLDRGIQGQLVEFYEEQVRKTMIELSQ